MARAEVSEINPNGGQLPNVGHVKLVKEETYVPHQDWDIQLRRNPNMQITNSLIFKASELIETWPSDGETAQFSYKHIYNQSRAMHGTVEYLEKAWDRASKDIGSQPYIDEGFLTVGVNTNWYNNFPVAGISQPGY